MEEKGEVDSDDNMVRQALVEVDGVLTPCIRSCLRSLRLGAGLWSFSSLSYPPFPCIFLSVLVVGCLHP